MSKFRLGVDGGGSKTHAVLVDENYHIIDETITGPANIKTDINMAILSITKALDTLIKKHHLKIEEITVGIGVAGFSDQINRKTLLDRLKPSYPKIAIESDAYIACLAAHSTHDGGILVCGTGVVGYFIVHGIGTQIGGWGFPHGDIGGGAWLGLEICRILCGAIDGAYEFTPLLKAVYDQFHQDKNHYKNWLSGAKAQDYAEIAKLITEFNIQHDPHLVRINNSGINAISNLINILMQKTNNIAITGGLANFYYKQLKTQYPDLLLSATINAIGACYLQS